MDFLFGAQQQQTPPPPYSAALPQITVDLTPPGTPAPAPCCGGAHQHPHPQRRRLVGGVADVRRIGAFDPDAELVGVIVTIANGSSYDKLFTTIKQQGAAGTRTAVWTATPAALPGIIDALESAASSAADPAPAPVGGGVARGGLAALVADVRAVDADAVAFNWECSSGCSDGGFGADAAATLRATRHCLGRGHMAMFSDFSLKALIADWDAAVLGPCPFRRIGDFGGSMELRFDPAALAAAPSAQLQTLGKLCADSGKATLHAMPSTIAYTVDSAAAAAAAAGGHYTLDVLTVAAALSGLALPREGLCATGPHVGAAGHTVLRYPSGGKLLTSCGHWIELSKLDVSEDALLQITESEYGAEAAAQLRRDLDSSATPELRTSVLQRRSTECIQMQSCAVYSPRKG